MIARKSKAWLLAAVVGLCGCQPTVYLMPAPVGLPAEKGLNVTPDEEKDGSIVIGYATNRLPDKRDKHPFYKKKFDDTLRFGVATVQIGKEAQSWDELHRLSAERDRKEKLKMVLTGIDHRAALTEDENLETLNPELEAMFGALNRRIENSSLHDITVYVHGANCNFYRVAAQAAQYRHFTSRTSAVIFYAWPSAENVVRYSKDVENIEATVPTFVRFIKMLALHSSAERINILAYSAGAQLTTKSL